MKRHLLYVCDSCEAAGTHGGSCPLCRTGIKTPQVMVPVKDIEEALISFQGDDQEHTVVEKFARPFLTD